MMVPAQGKSEHSYSKPPRRAPPQMASSPSIAILLVVLQVLLALGLCAGAYLLLLLFAKEPPTLTQVEVARKRKRESVALMQGKNGIETGSEVLHTTRPGSANYTNIPDSFNEKGLEMTLSFWITLTEPESASHGERVLVLHGHNRQYPLQHWERDDRNDEWRARGEVMGHVVKCPLVKLTAPRKHGGNLLSHLAVEFNSTADVMDGVVVDDPVHLRNLYGNRWNLVTVVFAPLMDGDPDGDGVTVATGSVVRVYFNDVPVAVREMPGVSLKNNDAPYYVLPARPAGTSLPVQGKISRVQYHNFALSETSSPSIRDLVAAGPDTRDLEDVPKTLLPPYTSITTLTQGT